jgi:hypothetical protein
MQKPKQQVNRRIEYYELDDTDHFDSATASQSIVSLGIRIEILEIYGRATAKRLLQAAGADLLLFHAYVFGI